MRVLILRSINFADKIEDSLVNKIVKGYREKGHEVAIYNMPACDDTEHWAGFAIVDYNMWSDILICIDFPTALIAHKNKRIILTKPLPKDPKLQLAIDGAIQEALDCTNYNNINYKYEAFPGKIEDYITKGETIL